MLLLLYHVSVGCRHKEAEITSRFELNLMAWELKIKLLLSFFQLLLIFLAFAVQSAYYRLFFPSTGIENFPHSSWFLKKRRIVLACFWWEARNMKNMFLASLIRLFSWQLRMKIKLKTYGWIDKIWTHRFWWITFGLRQWKRSGKQVTCNV